MMLIFIKKKNIYMFIFTFALIFAMCCMLLVSALNSNDKNQYKILIYIEENRLYLFENDICIKDYPIASGKPGWPSPIGQWKIVKKENWGEGFGGYWLGLDVLWGKYGIHGTLDQSSVGYAKSHGCIRMLHKDIQHLYNIVPIGTRVLINGGPYGSFGTKFRNLVPGDRGADVLEVQLRLNMLGYFNGKLNGIYEDSLKKALYEFQKDNNLKIKYTITRDDYNVMGIVEFE